LQLQQAAVMYKVMMIQHIKNIDIPFSTSIHRIVSSKKYWIFRYIAISFI